jgi:uncharacterized Zn finger protein
MEFFDRPDVERYKLLQKAAARVDGWDAMRPKLLHWLETGQRPDLDAATPSSSGAKRKGKTETSRPKRQAWPLPAIELTLPAPQGGYASFPDTCTLIAIAIEERRNDDVLKWYDHENRGSSYGGDYHGDTVASAVQETHPEAALRIWRRLAEAQIAVTKPAAYQTAGCYLEKMRAVYRRAGRIEEWHAYLAALRVKETRKRRLIEVLDSLEGKRTRILDKK